MKVDGKLILRAIDALADCAELRSVDEKLGAETLQGIAAELNAKLPAKRRVDFSRRAANPWRWLSGAHLGRFRERLLLELGVRYMEVVSYEHITPDDRPLEQLVGERLAIIRAESSRAPEVPMKGVESWLRLPSPSVTYDLDSGLGEPSAERYEALDVELQQATLGALRECTEPDEWLYAVDEPEGFSRCFRFWPHRAAAGMGWEVSSIPDGDDQVFLAQDFSWGMYATYSFDESVDWALSIFGRPLIDAFSMLQPQALCRVIRIDGKPL